MSPSQGEDREFESRCPLHKEEPYGSFLLHLIPIILEYFEQIYIYIVIYYYQTTLIGYLLN